MKSTLLVLLLVLAVAAAAGLAVWGNGQRLLALDMHDMLGRVHAKLAEVAAPAAEKAAEGEAADATVPATALSDERLEREILQLASDLRSRLDLAEGTVAAQKTEIAEYRGRAEAAEKRVDIVAASARSQAAAAAEAARQETSEQIADARKETERALDERVKAMNDLHALQVRYDELKGEYEAFFATKGQDVALKPAKLGGETEDEEVDLGGSNPVDEEGAVAEGSDAVAEGPVADTLLADIPETPETENDYAMEVDSAVVGISRYFLTIAYSLSEQTLTFQLQNGETLVYQDISTELADQVSQSEDDLDATYERVVKGQFPCDRKEPAVWRAYEKWAEANAQDIEVLWSVKE